MSSIDWSKAPEDAEAGYCGISQAYDAWYRRDGAGQVQQMCPAAGYPDWTCMGGRNDFPIGAELRPVAESISDGKSLPPVGSDQHIEPDNRIVRVLAHGVTGGDTVAICQDGKKITFAYPEAFLTAEQVAAYERKTQSEQLASIIAGYDGFDDPRDRDMKLAEYLLDHDYRKQVQP